MTRLIPARCTFARPRQTRRTARAPRRAILFLCAASFAIAAQPSFAAPSCTFTSATAVSFGAYNVFATSPNDAGVGSLTIRCTGGGGPSFIVTLSTGQSNNYVSRVMKSGSNQLTYNLYTSTARTTVWGDGTGGTGTLSAAASATTTLSVFGRIPAGQDAAVGSYTDSIIATVTF